MKFVTTILLLAFAVASQATQIKARDLADLVTDADWILIGTVTNIDMIDFEGNQVTNELAATGPGERHVLRLFVKVHEDGIIKSSSSNVPPALVIDLWTALHSTLKFCREEHAGKTCIFMLKGSDFQWGDPDFMRELSYREEIETILEKNR